MQYAELQDKVTSSETKVLEMETTIEDLQWDIEKLRKREQKLNKHLAEALEQASDGFAPGEGTAVESLGKELDGGPFCTPLTAHQPLGGGV